MAASAGAIRAGRAFVELFADDSKLVRALNAASKRVKMFGASVATIGRQVLTVGTAMFGALAGAAKAFADMGGNLEDIRDRTGVSVEALSELDWAASLAGTDMATLEGGLRKMQKFLVQAAEGSQGANDALAALGLTMADLGALSPEDQFKLIGDRLNQIANPTLRAALAMEVFGKSGTALLPMFLNGAAGIEEWMRQAREMGLTISTEDAQAAGKFGDALDALWRTIKAGVFHIGAALAPTLTDFANQARDVIKQVSDWVGQNKELIATVLKVAAGIAVGGAAVLVLGTAISGVGAMLGVAASALGMVSGLLGALLSPIGLVVAGLTGLGAWFFTSTETGADALKWLGEMFDWLVGIADEAIGGIFDAIAAGDLALAAEVAWNALRTVFYGGMNRLMNAWGGWAKGLAKTLIGALRAVGHAWDTISSSISSAMVKLALKTPGSPFSNAVLGDNAWEMAQREQKVQVGQAEAKGTRAATAAEDARRELATLRGGGAIEPGSATAEYEKELEDKIKASTDAAHAAAARARDLMDAPLESFFDDLAKPMQASIADTFDAKTRGWDDAMNAAENWIDTLDAKEDEARAEFQDAVQRARRARASLPAAPGGPRKPGQPPEALDLEGLGKTKYSSAGTFNAALAGMLGAGTAPERTAKATEETARLTRRFVFEGLKTSIPATR